MQIGRYIIGILSLVHSEGVGLSMRSSAYFASWLSVARFFWESDVIPVFRSIRGGQWVSITRELVDYLLEQEERALTIFAHTFGADEYFIPTLIWGTPFIERLFDATDESRGAMRYIGWRDDGQLIDFTPQDLPALQQTEYIFARKFNSRDRGFLQEILALSTP